MKPVSSPSRSYVSLWQTGHLRQIFLLLYGSVSTFTTCFSGSTSLPMINNRYLTYFFLIVHLRSVLDDQALYSLWNWLLKAYFLGFPIHGKEDDISYPCMAYPSNAILLDYDSLLSYWESQFSLREFVSKSQTISSIN